MTLQFRVTDRKAIGLLVIVIAAAWSDILLLGRGFYLEDVISYHYPMKAAVREVVSRGTIPYWNRLVSSGQPMAANPAYEVWYPPQWLVFLPSFHYGLQLHIVLHIFIAAIGMYLLLRSLDLSIAASIFGALAFVFSGPYLSLSAKLTLLFAISWMPLVLYFVRQIVGGRAGSPPSSLFFAGAALTAAMQLLIGEPTIVLQTWGLIAAYVIWRRSFRRDVPRAAAVAVVAALVAAVQLIPAIDFARDTARASGFPFVIVSNWSMPLIRPAEMLIPSLFEHIRGENGAPMVRSMYAYRTDAYIGEIYLGMFVALLAAAGFIVGRRFRGATLTLFAIAFIAAAGGHTPLLKVLYNLHLMRTIRYPEKFILAGAFVLIVWAAMLFDRLRDDDALARTMMILASIAAVVMLFAISSDAPYWGWNIARAAAVIALAGPARKRLPRGAWQSAVIALTTIDLYASMQRAAPRMPRSFFNPPPLVAAMPKSTEFRLFHEAAWDVWDQRAGAVDRLVGPDPDDYWRHYWAGLFPNLPALYGRALALEDDIDQTSLKTTDDLRELLKSVRRRGDIVGEATLLKLSNARWRFRFAGELVTIDETLAHPRYAFADSIVPAASAGEMQVNLDQAAGDPKVAFTAAASFTPSPGAVTAVEERDNSVRLTTRNQGRGLLLIAVTAPSSGRRCSDSTPSSAEPSAASSAEIRERLFRTRIRATASTSTTTATSTTVRSARRWVSLMPPRTRR